MIHVDFGLKSLTLWFLYSLHCVPTESFMDMIETKISSYEQFIYSLRPPYYVLVTGTIHLLFFYRVLLVPRDLKVHLEQRYSS